MLKRPYILLALLMMHINNFAQTDQVECDAFSINVIKENNCLPASFTLGINGYNDDLISLEEPLPMGNVITGFVWTPSKNLKKISFNTDSTEITLLSIGDTLSHKIYLDVKLSEELSCRDSINIKAIYYDTETTEPIPTSTEKSIDFDFTEAGERCSTFDLYPENFNNDSFTYKYKWEMRDPEDKKLYPYFINKSAYFPLDQEGSYDLYVKVIECGESIVYRDSLIKDFVNIKADIELVPDSTFFCLDPKDKEYRLSIKDFSPISEYGADISDTIETEWEISKREYNLRGQITDIHHKKLPTNPNMSNNSSASYLFDEAGNYMVEYRIESNICVHSDRHAFNIGVVPQFIYPKIEDTYKERDYFPKLCSGKSDVFFPFKSTSYLDLGSKSKYSWHSNNTSVVIENSEQNKTDIAFRDEGEFKLTLHVENNFGCIDSISRTIHVKNAKPENQPLKLKSTVTKDENIQLSIDSIKLDTGYYFQVNRWDPYFGWIEDYTRTDSILIRDNDVGVSSDQYEYQVTYLDQCGNIGGISNYSTNILLEGRSTADKHMLTWNNIKEWPGGVEKYEIQRYNQKEKIFEPIDSIINDYSSPNTAMDSVFVDEAIKSEYCYRIQAYLVNSSDTVLSNTLCYTAELKEHFPTAFTPNNDGINDVFEFVGAHAKSLKVAIYSKWGQAVFSSNKIDFQWDGMDENSGKLCHQGVYIVKYEVVDFDNIKTSNHVNLMLIRN